MSIAYTITPTAITVVVGFAPKVIPSSHPNFEVIRDLVKKKGTTEAQLAGLLDIPAAISRYSDGEVKVVGGKLFYRGVEVNDNLGKVILGFVMSGQEEAAEPFKRFLTKVRSNPDINLISTIYDWCVKSNMPITPDGDLLAWKIVGPDFYSKRAGVRGRLSHKIGETVSEPREECDTDRNRTCSTGVHFCSLEYVQSGNYASFASGDHVMAVTINPANITAIPTDYNLSKGRCCELTVVGEVAPDDLPTFYGKAKVYSGWAPATPAPAPKPVRAVKTFTKRLAPGDEVVLRDGRKAVIGAGNVSGIVQVLVDGVSVKSVYTCSGRNWKNERGYTDERYDRPTDVISVTKKAKVTARNSGGFAVGQVWQTRDGRKQVKITSISGSEALYPVIGDNGVVYTAMGRYFDNSSESGYDLARLTQDVA